MLHKYLKKQKIFYYAILENSTILIDINPLQHNIRLYMSI